MLSNEIVREEYYPTPFAFEAVSGSLIFLLETVP